jgi:hypothetical protein
MTASNHTWQFARIGGVSRVVLNSGADLQHLDELDPKLWTALSCPVNGLEMDAHTLTWIDSDKDGKIRVPEVLAAVRWIVGLVNNPDDLIGGKQSMPLSAINQSTPEGKQLYASAKQILVYLKKKEEVLTVAETSNNAGIFANSTFNGDGIIGDTYSNDPIEQEAIRDIMATLGSKPDRGGNMGISADELNSFAALCTAFAAWHKKGEEHKTTVLPFGDKTAAGYALFVALKSKLDDYFLRCRLAEFDPASAETLNTLSARILAINSQDISNCIAEISGFPIAKIEANRPFSFDSPINPAWRDQLLDFIELLTEFRDKTSRNLTENEWKELSQKFSAYAAWQAEKPAGSIESLGIDKITAFLANNMQEKIQNLINQDLELSDEADNIILVDKLVRYYTEIYTLLSNFVTFSDFYNPNKKAIFQAGKVYFDQRTCNLCIKVTDLAKHSAMATNSAVCLVYFECTSKTKNEKITIVTALTDGDVDNLHVGRNAIFYDNSGLDWDATVVKIIDNPISIRQAFWTPYRKMGQLITNQIEKIAAAQDAKVSTATNAGIEGVSTKANAALSDSIKPTEVKPAVDAATPVVPPPPADPAAPKPAEPAKTSQAFDIAKFAGIFAAIGLALGAIGGVVSSIITGLMVIAPWQIPLIILALLLIISGPSMVIAWLKLRKRNLAPILDANGWAINAKANINISFGASLTDLAILPKNSKLNLHDPFLDKRNPLIPIIIVLLVLLLITWGLWDYGYLHYWGILSK